MNELYESLSHPSRRKILRLLKGGSLSVAEIGVHFEFTGPTLSRHLSKLSRANLVSSQKKGNRVYYTLNLSVLELLLVDVGDLLNAQKKEK